MRPRPSARSVPRWRWLWPIALRTWVTLSFAIRTSPASSSRRDASVRRGSATAARRLGGRLGRAALRLGLGRRAARLDRLGGRPARPRAPPRRGLALLACLDGRLIGRTSPTVLPRARATSSGRRSDCSAFTVALAMLIGFVVPRLFASTSRMPASSSTARTPPPAMTPVPSLAGRRKTRAASKRPSDLVRDRLAVLGDAEEVLLRVVDGLRDRERHLARLAVADADAVDLVADHDERGEREPPAALDHLGDAVDLDHALLELSRLLDVDCH